jgi:hypothetical protein
VGFLDINAQEMNVVAEFLGYSIEAHGLAPERGSGKGSEDQPHRFAAQAG